MKVYLAVIAALLACGPQSAHAFPLTSAALVASPTPVYANGKLDPAWYNNSWSSTVALNSTGVLFGTEHTAKVSYSAWGAFALAMFSGQIRIADHDTLSFEAYAGGTAVPTLAAQLFVDNITWGPVVALSSYCSLAKATWVLCQIPISALAPTGTGYSEIVIEESAGHSAPSTYFADVQLVTVGTTAPSDAGSPPPADAGTGTADAGTSDAGAPPPPPPPATSLTHLAVQAFASQGTAALLVDGAYRWPNAWTFTPGSCTAAAPCYAGAHVGAGPTQLLLHWSYEDGEGDFSTVPFGGQTVTAYAVQTSANSTTGLDGTWTTVATVSGNHLIHRSHLVPFAGASWVRLAISGSSTNELDELDLWDASAGGDGYFFHGDSVTHRCANLRGTNVNYGEQPSFQADLAGYPPQIGAGIVGEGALDAANEIGAYLAAFPEVRTFFLTMGTNDLCGGAAAYSTHAQPWIDAVKAAGRVPVLVHPIWANNVAAYCPGNGPALNAAVDALVTQNGLSPAVPLYEATVGHPEDFDSGDVHPNAAGCAAWNQTFARYAAAHR